MPRLKGYSHFVNENRIYIVFVCVFSLASLLAPKFFNAFNLVNILSTTVLYGIVSIGFTIALICGHLDLSVLAVINLAGVITITVGNATGNWVLAIAAATLAGALVGVINGLLVTKAKINSFIATLGTLTTFQGGVYYITNGATVSTGDYTASDWMSATAIPIVPNAAVVAILLVLGAHLFMRRTFIGRGFYLVGSNIDTAWLAGLKINRYLVTAFVGSGATSALGSAFFACSLAAAMANLGEKGINPLMIVIAAVVLGGTQLSGGKGSILKSYFGVLSLTVLFNALTCFRLGYELQIFICGIILMVVVFVEVVSMYQGERLRGIRAVLRDEARRLKLMHTREGQGKGRIVA